MKIVVVSDTHHNYHILKSIVLKNQDADLFIHLGDGEHEFADVKREFPNKKFIFVKGNVDFVDAKIYQVVGVSGYKIFATHGDYYNVHEGLDRLIEAAKENDCKIALYGHTHLYQTKIEDGVYILNPGSPSSPRDKKEASYGVVEIGSNGEIGMRIVAISK